MNNHNLELENKEKPQIAYSEIKQKALITDIELRKDKNNKDFWIIRTQLDEKTVRNYLAFSTDYNITAKTVSLLVNYPHQLVNRMVDLTIKKKDDSETVINLEIER